MDSTFHDWFKSINYQQKIVEKQGFTLWKTKPNSFINNVISAKMRYLTNNKFFINVILQIAAHTQFWC